MLNNERQTNPRRSVGLKAGSMLALTLLGALAGYATSGDISDGPTQSKWIAQGAFWGALAGALTGTLVNCLASGLKIRLSAILELVLVAAFISMLLSNLLHWNSVLQERHNRNLEIEEKIRADYNAFVKSLRR